MVYRRIAPDPATADFVDHFWSLEGGDPGAVQRVVPDGCPALIIHLGQPLESWDGSAWQEQPRSFVAGQLTGPMLLRSTGPSHIIGANFRPHGLSQFLNAPAHELTGRIEPLDLDAAAFVGQAIRLSTTARTGESPVPQLARPDPLIAEAVRRLTDSPAQDIATLARDFGISTRHLERRFLDRVGLPPKLYARMRRFQSVFPAIQNGGNWIQAALACGYYDQAHLIRDFREFAGEPPTALLATDDLARHFLSHFSKTPPPALR